MSSNKVYEIITETVIAKLEQGVAPWQKPWKGGSNAAPANFITKKPYKGFNALITAFAGFESPYWLTFKQIRQKKGKLQKGEKGTQIIYYNFIETDEIDKNTGKYKTIPIIRYSTVFNLDQTDIKCPYKKSQENVAPANDFQINEEAEKIVQGYTDKPEIRHGGGQAYYSPKEDYVQMPEKESFNGTPEYYSTLFHELAHSTGAASRLKRDGIVKFDKFGSHQYSQEELVAEITACFLNSMAGITCTIDNSVAYIESWSKKLKANPKWLVQAASQAQKAADHILGVTPNSN